MPLLCLLMDFEGLCLHGQCTISFVVLSGSRIALGGLAEYALERGLCVFSVDSIAHISNIGDITKEDKMLCSKLSRKEFFG